MLSDRMKKVWNQFSSEEKKSIEEQYQTLRAEYLTLQELRKRQKVTQEDIAKLLGINQENVSRMERRENIRLSTLKDYIEALGGEVQIQAVFPDNQIVNIVSRSSLETAGQ